MIIGESGSGKSTSIRNMDPKNTFLLQVINKPLPFRGANKLYKPITKDDKGKSIGNKVVTDDFNKISKSIEYISDSRKEIKTIIIDDFQYIMSLEFMRRAEEKGWDKFAEIAAHIFKVIDTSIMARADLNVVLLAHSTTDDMGRTKLKTIGKMIDEKITLEGMCTVVLHSKIVDDRYVFQTQGDATTIAKSPIEMFEERYIDNDLKHVIDTIEKYYDEDVKM